MPAIDNQVSSKGPAISRAVPALAAIEANLGNPALAPAFGGSYGPEHRGHGQTDSLKSIYNPYRMRATMSGVQTIIAANQANPNWQLLNFDTITGSNLFDYNNNFSTSTHQYTTPFQGRYEVKARVSGGRGTTNNNILVLAIAIFVNGAEYSRGHTQLQILSFDVGAVTQRYGGPMTAVHSDQIAINQGDLVDVRAANYGQGGDNFATDTTVNYFAIARVE